jgi:hypothetical protein
VIGLTGRQAPVAPCGARDAGPGLQGPCQARGPGLQGPCHAYPCASLRIPVLCRAHPCPAHPCAGEPKAGACGCARHKTEPGRVGGVEARRCAALARRPRCVGIVRGRPRPHRGYLLRVRLSQQRVSPGAAPAHLRRLAGPGTAGITEALARTRARDESSRACAKEGAVRRCGGRSAARADTRAARP